MGLGVRLKEILKAEGLTIKELSEMSGVSINTLYSITKRDNIMARYDIVKKIAETLHIDIEELIGQNIDYDKVENVKNARLYEVVQREKQTPLDMSDAIKKVSQKADSLIASNDTTGVHHPVNSKGKSNQSSRSDVIKDIIIDSILDESHPFNTLQKKIENGESLTKEEFEQYNKHILNSVSSIQDSLQKLGVTLKQSFSQYYAVLNEAGQKEADIQIEKVIEKVSKQAEAQIRDEAENQIKLLTRIPEYQKR